jgi:WD40 repeat protein
VVAGCHEAVVHIWRVIHKQEGEEEEEEGIELEQLTMSGYEKRVSMADFDRLEHRYLATCGGAQLIVWDFAETPQGSVPTVGVGHRKMITCQSWQNEEPGLLATGSKDGTVLFYDVTDIAVPGAPNLCLPGVAAPLPGDREDEATALIWGPDGKVFVGHVSGTLRAWNLPLNP